jgi:NADPH-dependent 2,4-dienoyl-CoA reductase/sulfur reductase-like enzyme
MKALCANYCKPPSGMTGSLSQFLIPFDDSRAARIAASPICERIAAIERRDISTEVVIIGAGPAGLFQVFELGLLGIKAHLSIRSPSPGGQCTELYPDKPIYDIPALPVCGAQELVDRLMQQIKPFGATMHLGEEAMPAARRTDGRFGSTTAAGTVFDAGAVVIAAGVGSFQPRHLSVPKAWSIRRPARALQGQERRRCTASAW